MDFSGSGPSLIRQPSFGDCEMSFATRLCSLRINFVRAWSLEPTPAEFTCPFLNLLRQQAHNLCVCVCATRVCACVSESLANPRGSKQTAL